MVQRWHIADITGEFIPVYERDGLIVKLDEYFHRSAVCKKEEYKGEELLPYFC